MNGFEVTKLTIANTHPPVNFQNKTTHYQMSGVFIVVKVDEVDEGVF